MKNLLQKIAQKKILLILVIILAGLALAISLLRPTSPSNMDGVQKVEQEQFKFCDTLEEITIPRTVNTIEKEAFCACDKLQRVEFESDSQLTAIENNAFYRTKELKQINLPTSLREIGDYAFSRSGLIEIVIPEGVTSIGNNVFEECTSLTTITVPATTTTIGAAAFYNCQSLHEIVVHPENPVYCSVDGVLYNKDMTELIFCPPKAQFQEFPTSVTTIREMAFSYYNKNINVFIPATITNIGARAFELSNIASVVFAEDTQIKTLPEGVFSCCRNLSEFTIPQSIEKIDNEAFRDCNHLDNLIIPANVKSIGYAAFTHTGITQLTLPETVEEYDLAAFSGCYGLTKVQLPNNMESIPQGIFRDCTSLTEIAIPNSVKEIQSSAFSGCTSLQKIELPDTVEIIGGFAFQDCHNLLEINLPPQITSIPEYAFSNCQLLQMIEIPQNVTRIEQYAFKGCQELQEVLLPSRLEYIGKEAFRGCAGMTHLTIPASVTRMDTKALSDMENLNTLVFLADESHSSNTILEKSLLAYTTNLKSLTLTPHIERIAEYAFSDSNIEKIYFLGTSEQWEDIEKEQEALPESAAIIFTNTCCHIHGGYEGDMRPSC